MVAFKVIVVPALIGVVSLAGRRWGSAVSGWLAGFPWTSGPIALLLTLEHGPAFGAQAAHGIMLGLVSAAAFCWSYSRFARSSGWVSSLLRGWAVFGLVTLALARLRIGSTAGFAMVLVVLSAALAAWPAGRPVEARPNFPAWDIPSRMFAALALAIALVVHGVSFRLVRPARAVARPAPGA